MSGPLDKRQGRNQKQREVRGTFLHNQKYRGKKGVFQCLGEQIINEKSHKSLLKFIVRSKSIDEFYKTSDGTFMGKSSTFNENNNIILDVSLRFLIKSLNVLYTRFLPIFY